MKKEQNEETRQEALMKYRVYTLTELEEIIGVSHRTLLRYVKDGTLQAVKIGGKWRVSEEKLKSFLEGSK